MNDDEGRVVLPKTFNLNTFVILASVAASFWAQWAVFTERSDRQAQYLERLDTRMDGIEMRVRSLESDLNRAKGQIDDLRDRRGASLGEIP